MSDAAAGPTNLSSAPAQPAEPHAAAQWSTPAPSGERATPEQRPEPGEPPPPSPGPTVPEPPAPPSQPQPVPPEVPGPPDVPTPPADPAGRAPALPHTGDAQVDAALEELTHLTARPVEEQVDVYVGVHRRLQDRLADLDG